MERIGDHRAGQNIIFGQWLAMEDGLRVDTGIDALLHHQPRHRTRIIAMNMAITLRDHRIGRVLAKMAVRNLELGLRGAEQIGRGSEIGPRAVAR